MAPFQGAALPARSKQQLPGRSQLVVTLPSRAGSRAGRSISPAEASLLSLPLQGPARHPFAPPRPKPLRRSLLLRRVRSKLARRIGRSLCALLAPRGGGSSKRPSLQPKLLEPLLFRAVPVCQPRLATEAAHRSHLPSYSLQDFLPRNRSRAELLPKAVVALNSDSGTPFATVAGRSGPTSARRGPPGSLTQTEICAHQPFLRSTRLRG